MTKKRAEKLRKKAEEQRKKKKKQGKTRKANRKITRTIENIIYKAILYIVYPWTRRCVVFVFFVVLPCCFCCLFCLYVLELCVCVCVFELCVGWLVWLVGWFLLASSSKNEK